jgi:hypothetical protein
MNALHTTTRRRIITLSRILSNDINSGKLYGVASGTDTYVLTITGFGRLSIGKMVIATFTNANTGAATLNVSGTGAVAIRKKGVALSANDMDANGTYVLVYDGTYWQAVSGVLA